PMALPIIPLLLGVVAVGLATSSKSSNGGSSSTGALTPSRARDSTVTSSVMRPDGGWAKADKDADSNPASKPVGTTPLDRMYSGNFSPPGEVIYGTWVDLDTLPFFRNFYIYAPEAGANSLKVSDNELAFLINIFLPEHDWPEKAKGQTRYKVYLPGLDPFL